MKRTLSWLVAGALVAGLGGASLANSEDSLMPLQDPPEMTIGQLHQVFGSIYEGNSTAVNRIMPSASQATVRDGFRSNASDSDVRFEGNSGVSFPNTFESEDSVDFERVVPGSRDYWYRQQVTVTTNGPTESIKRVGYCLINSEDSAVQSGDGFQWYDATDTNETNDIERNCGFNDDDPTSSGSPDNARAVISMIYNVGADSFALQGSSEHELPTGDRKAEASWDGQTLTVHFAFKPSHALQKASSGWVIRAAAQDLPRANETDFDPQVSQIFWGNTAQTEGEVTSDEASRSSWKFASVAYYGAIVAARSNVNYGALGKDEERLVTGITTGRYLANSESELLIHASNFNIESGDATDTAYASLVAGLRDNEVVFRCSYDPNDTDLKDQSSTPNDLVNTLPRLFKENLPSTTDLATPEDSQEMEKISCSLVYGGGATNAGEVYKNNVYISIRDSGALVPPVIVDTPPEV